MKYRVTFSVMSRTICSEPTYVALATEPVEDLDFAREAAVALKEGKFESVYLERLESGVWVEMKGERILIDGRP